LKLIFLGNTKYSVIGQRIIHEIYPLSLVVTIPDRPSSRKKELKPSPVKTFSKENNIPVIETDELDNLVIDKIDKLKPDFLIVEDYGLILPKELLNLAKYASLNIHHSLLPKYRGPSPAPAAILAGEEKSGVTIIKMTEKVDAGDILAQKECELAPNETTDSLLTKLNALGGQLVCQVIRAYLKYMHLHHPRGEIKTKPGMHPIFLPPKPQDESQATYTHRLKKENGFINFENPPNPQTFNRMVRAFYPWPGTWSKVKVKSGKSITIKFLPGNLIQPEGKKPMTIKEFLNGYPEAKDLIDKIYLIPTTRNKV